MVWIEKMKTVSVNYLRCNVIEQCSKLGIPKNLNESVKNKWNWN